jgi:hypothetical protein
LRKDVSFCNGLALRKPKEYFERFLQKLPFSPSVRLRFITFWRKMKVIPEDLFLNILQDFPFHAVEPKVLKKIEKEVNPFELQGLLKPLDMDRYTKVKCLKHKTLIYILDYRNALF